MKKDLLLKILTGLGLENPLSSLLFIFLLLLLGEENGD